MVDIIDSPAPSSFPPVTRAEVTDIALGGNETNFPNRQNKELALRDRWLKAACDVLQLSPAQTIQGVKNLLAGDAVAAVSQAVADQYAIASFAQGRLTLQSGTPTTLTNITAATTLYYSPAAGDLISLFNGSANRWDAYNFTERSLSLSGLAANTNHDIFIFDNAGTLTLQAIPWTSSGAGSSVRVQAIGTKNGVLVKQSDNRRYIGTIRTTGTAGQCEDSETKRFVWNTDNKATRKVKASNNTSHTYAVANVWRMWNNSNAHRFELVNGYDSTLSLFMGVDGQGTGVSLNVGINSDTVPGADFYAGFGNPSTTDRAIGIHTDLPPRGYNYYQALEAVSTGTGTFLGFGFTGTWDC
jgi:hypothetical protein